MIAEAHPEVVAPAAYQDYLRALTGRRDPLDVLAGTPGILEEIVSSHSPARLRKRPGKGRWAPIEIVGHLLDSALVRAFRLRMTLGENQPTLPNMDQERWVARQHYLEADAACLVRWFRAVQEADIALSRRLTPDDLERVGYHETRGLQSIAMMLREEAGHELHHDEQLYRSVAACLR